MLSVVVATLTIPPATSDVCKADDNTHATESHHSAWTVKIVSAKAAHAVPTEIVIAPAAQTTDDNAAPILIAPTYAEQPDEKQIAKAAIVQAKPVRKQTDKAPVATETASQKAREDWQQQGTAEAQKRKSKDKTSTASEKAPRAEKMLATRKTSDKDQDDERVKATGKKEVSAAPEEKMAVSEPKGKDSRSYREIYASIPFSRAEYDANPAYRHQATMEIMLGHLHPIVVAPAAPQQCQSALPQTLTVRFLPVIRSGYRVWSRYPWH